MEKKIQEFEKDLKLVGRKVELRFPQEADYPRLGKILSDPETMAHLKYMANIEAGGWTHDQLVARHTRWEKLRETQECLGFTVLDRETKEIIGQCGFYKINPPHKNAEFGIILHKTHWGNGYGADCHLLCLEYGFKKLKLHRVEFSTSVVNTKMRGFFESVGISLESIRRGGHFDEGVFKDDAIYAVFENEWPKVCEKLLAKIQ